MKQSFWLVQMSKIIIKKKDEKAVKNQCKIYIWNAGHKVKEEKYN